MEILNTVLTAREFIKEKKAKGLSIGLVPTMGYLHEGHLSLIKESKKKNDITVLSIFVNPTQFAPNEDFSTYPRDFARDAKLAEESGADAIFAPAAEELYPAHYQTYVGVEELTKHLCGKSRPTHFRGVTTIVSKLFHIFAPDRAYFGQKDAQQFFVIDRMVKDLNFNLELVMCPIVREADGLAKSSRNVFLDPEQRKQALCLIQALREAEAAVMNGERDAHKIIGLLEAVIAKQNLASLDYAEVVDTETLQSVDSISGRVLLALAVRFGKIRLIDNMILEVSND